MDHAIYTSAILNAAIVGVIVAGAGAIIAGIIHLLDPETRRARRNARRRYHKRAH